MQVDFLLHIALLLVLNSLFIFGVYKITEYTIEIKDGEVQNIDKMLLWKIRQLSVKYLGEYWSKPVCLCPPCMSSLWGTLFYAVFAVLLSGYSFTLLAITYPFYLLILVGLNSFLMKYFD